MDYDALLNLPLLIGCWQGLLPCYLGLSNLLVEQIFAV